MRGNISSAFSNCSPEGADLFRAEEADYIKAAEREWPNVFPIPSTLRKLIEQISRPLSQAGTLPQPRRVFFFRRLEVFLPGGTGAKRTNVRRLTEKDQPVPSPATTVFSVLKLVSIQTRFPFSLRRTDTYPLIFCGRGCRALRLYYHCARLSPFVRMGSAETPETKQRRLLRDRCRKKRRRLRKDPNATAPCWNHLLPEEAEAPASDVFSRRRLMQRLVAGVSHSITTSYSPIIACNTIRLGHYIDLHRRVIEERAYVAVVPTRDRLFANGVFTPCAECICP